MQPFYPGNSSVFYPDKSRSFSVVPKAMFLLGYADKTHLKGFQGEDVVHLGDLFVETAFGAITGTYAPAWATCPSDGNVFVTDGLALVG